LQGYSIRVQIIKESVESVTDSDKPIPRAFVYNYNANSYIRLRTSEGEDQNYSKELKGIMDKYTGTDEFRSETNKKQKNELIEYISNALNTKCTAFILLATREIEILANIIPEKENEDYIQDTDKLMQKVHIYT